MKQVTNSKGGRDPMNKEALSNIHPAWFTTPAGTIIGAILANALASKPSLGKTIAGTAAGTVAGLGTGYHKEIADYLKELMADKPAAPPTAPQTPSTYKSSPTERGDNLKKRFTEMVGPREITGFASGYTPADLSTLESLRQTLLRRIADRKNTTPATPQTSPTEQIVKK